MSRENIRQLARDAGAKFPELVVAQYVLESGDGKYLSGKFNYFGIKGKGTLKETTEYIKGKRITIKDEFKDFVSPAECVSYLVERWYKDWEGHKGVNRANTREEAANLLVSEGYATDPNYAAKLIRVMSETKEGPDYADLVDAAKNFKGEPQQVKALQDLQSDLTPVQREQFTKTWRAATAKPTQPAAPASATTPAKTSFPLKVPYFYQRDSKTGHGERMCFSSSMAMAMDYLNPDAIKGDDDWYIKQVFRFGDTVSSDAQLSAARSLGFDVQFRTNLSEADLLKQLDLGIPMPIGVLHKGPVSSPSGGGHWVCLTGYDATHFWVADPFGEMNVTAGGYDKTGPNDGNQVRYTRKNLMKRFLIKNDHDGWGMIFKK